MKYWVCVPYVLSQVFLFYVIYWAITNTNISESDGYYFGFLIATYGALVIASYSLLIWFKIRAMTDGS